MIVVELQRPLNGSVEYETAATLRVEDDGTWNLTGDQTLQGVTSLQVTAPDGGFISIDDDPLLWARHLGTSLRTGYLVPVITEDTEEKN